MIRIAVLNDAQQIAEVHVQSWKETYTGMINQEIIDELSVESRLKFWQKLLVDKNHRLLVCEKEGRILGFLDGYLNPDKNIAEIKVFYFLKQFKGQGLGRAMFEKFYQLILAEKYQYLKLGVIKQNPSRYFYEKMGGTMIGEELIPEYGDGVAELFYQWEIQKAV